ncbi:MAG TPA: hypothetical protein VM778_13675 [Gemmatimonadota bacterium]|nr:hypothetical protein [Gemmatimonadota bacterium]
MTGDGILRPGVITGAIGYATVVAFYAAFNLATYALSRERIRQIKDRAMGKLATGRGGRCLRALV